MDRCVGGIKISDVGVREELRVGKVCGLDNWKDRVVFCWVG